MKRERAAGITAAPCRPPCPTALAGSGAQLLRLGCYYVKLKRGVTSVENPSIAARGTHARADRRHRHLALARDHRCRGGSAVPDVSRAGRDRAVHRPALSVVFGVWRRRRSGGAPCRTGAQPDHGGGGGILPDLVSFRTGLGS